MKSDSTLVNLMVVVLVGDWTRFRCSCYYRSEEKRNWTESRRLCQNSGGDLVFIKNREENVSPQNVNLMETFKSRTET